MGGAGASRRWSWRRRASRCRTPWPNRCAGRAGWRTFAESKRIFLKDGKFYEAGELLVQPELARTLERIEKLGSKDFYEGETARLLAEDMAAHGGLITEADLKTVRGARARAAHRHLSRLHDRHRAAAEFGRGRAFCRCSACWTARATKRAAPDRPATIHYMTEAMRRFFADRSEHMGDPDFVKLPMTSLLSPKYIAQRRASIDPERATPSSQIKAAVFDGHESVRDHALYGGGRGRQRGRGDLHVERRIREQGDGDRTRLPVEQRDGRFRL